MKKERDWSLRIQKVYESSSAPIGSHWFDAKVNLGGAGGSREVVFLVKTDTKSSPPSG